MTIEKNEWLNDVRISPSPNNNKRPDNTNINLLVIHNISLPPKQYAGTYIEDFFLNKLDIKQDPYFDEIKDLHVSSHLLIRRNGEVIQFVPLSKRAWHAGESVFQDNENCNDFSIGIELEGCDTENFTDMQYEALIKLTKDIQNKYPLIKTENIKGHSDIAPNRKTDPGNYFNWTLYLDALVAK